MLPPPREGAAALVTGASSGIGAELAHQLAARGHALILLARRRERLDALAHELRAAHAVRAEVIDCDLSDERARENAIAATAELKVDVDLLFNCAGYGMTGPFTEHAPAVTGMVRTNVEAVMALCGAFAPPMVARGRGAVLIVSSLAGAGPMPGFAAYSATKAAASSFGEALHAELKPRGVTVTVLCPGPVDTEFGAVADIEATMQGVPRFLMADAEGCARAALAGLESGRRVVVPKLAVRALASVGAYMPHAVGLGVGRRMFL